MGAADGRLGALGAADGRLGALGAAGRGLRSPLINKCWAAIFYRTYLRAPLELVGSIDIRECLQEVYMSIGDAYGVVGALNRRVLGHTGCGDKKMYKISMINISKKKNKTIYMKIVI